MSILNRVEKFKTTAFPGFDPRIDMSLLSGVDLTRKYIAFPGFCDVHVHFREPGFSYKETIKSGSLAAAHGGFTDVCSMPNLNPVPDSEHNLKLQLDIIQKDAVIGVHPYASITVGEKGDVLSDMDDLYNKAVAFSDDGKGIQNREIMIQAMVRSKQLGKIIVAHCEDNSLLNGGYIHDGQYAINHNHLGICSRSEWGQIERDLNIAKMTGCSYHVCHISCKESVELIRQAKKDGIDVTCETAPHYLVLDETFLEESGKFKMNPPLRSKEDRHALLVGIADGTIDMVATDHAPHSAEEKSKGLEKSAFGIVGLETAFPVLYTFLVKEKIITIEKLVELMCINARKRFNIPLSENDYCIWDLEKEYVINPNDFLSKGKSTPFEGMKVFGECVLTVKDSKIVFKKVII